MIDSSATVSISLSLATICGGVVSLIKISSRFAAVELKANTMWEFQMRRAFSEVHAQQGLARQNSPLRFTHEALLRLEPIKDELRTFWEAHSSGLSDAEALLQIEHLFGAKLITTVCLPCSLSHGACLLLALSIAKGTDEVTFVQ